MRRVFVVCACGVEHGLDGCPCRGVGLLDPSGLRAVRRGRSEAAGEQRANLLASFAPCEQQRIAQRTRQALARTRAQGILLGRPPTMSAYAIERIRSEHAAGNSLAAIANGLNTDHVPTAQGGRRWYPATIRHTLNRTS